jgi:hypothetical protein
MGKKERDHMNNMPLYTVPKGISTRWASPENGLAEKGAACRGNDGHKRSPSFELPAGRNRVLADIKVVSETVRRFWMTIADRSSKMLRGLRFKVYWDGAGVPAISVPAGDFVCHGLGIITAFEKALFNRPIKAMYRKDTP